MHLSQIGVKTGDKIKQGQIIGKAGNTGPIPGMASHLHFGIRNPSGTYVDPENIYNSYGLSMNHKNSLRESGGGIVVPQDKLSNTQAMRDISNNRSTAGLFEKSTGKMVGQFEKSTKVSSAVMMHSSNVLAQTNNNIISSSSNNSSVVGGGNQRGSSSFQKNKEYTAQLLACNV